MAGHSCPYVFVWPIRDGIMDDSYESSYNVDEAGPLNPQEWDVVQSIHGFNKLAKLVRHALNMTPRIIDTQTNTHPLELALDVIFDCKQAALLAYGKVMWQDAHDLYKDVTNKNDKSN